MSEIGPYCAAIAASVGATLVAGWVLRRHLAYILAELCGSRERGDFWMALASLCALLAATAASTFPYPPVFLHPILQCASGLAGVLTSLLVLAGALLLFIRRFEDCPRAASPPANGAETSGRCEPEQRTHTHAGADLDAEEPLSRMRRRIRQCRDTEDRR
jgi:hypothetical protein